MTNLDLGTPSKKQEKALKDTHSIVGYGGARGGGKSWVIRTKAIIMAASYPSMRILIMRQTYPELLKNHITQLRSMLRGIAKYNKTEKELTFVNDSIIDFQYCRNDDDLERLQGSEYDLIFIDEATNFNEYQLKAIRACCRGTNSFPKRVYMTFNPGGQGHGYIKRIFIDRKYEDGEDPEDYSFTQALVTDNKALMDQDPNYIKTLDSLPAKLKKAWRYGEWDVFEGQFFEDFTDNPEHYIDRTWTNVIDPFPIPHEWTIYRSYDYGYSKPFSCAWWAVDHDGIIYRILELYGCTGEPNEGVKWTPNEQFKKISEIEDQHPFLKGKKIHGIADPAIFATDRGDSIADTAQKYGIYFEPGDNQRISGWMQVHYRFSFDDNGIPMMYVFNTCKGFIRTIPLMMYDKTKVEDLDTTLEDHISDETRYMCMARPIKPPISNKHMKLEDDPLNQRVPKRRDIYVRHDN